MDATTTPATARPIPPTPPVREPRLGDRLSLIGAAALFSTGGAAIKATSLTGWQVASFRSGIAAVAVLLLVKAARRRWSGRVLLVSVAYAITMVLFVSSNKATTAANAIFLQSTAPLYVLLLSPLLLREHARRSDLVAMAIIALGLALVVAGVPPAAATAPNPTLGNVLAIASGCTWALTVIGLRWLGSAEGGESATLSTVVAGNLFACLACLPLALPVGATAPVDWAVVGYLGVIQIGLAYLLLVRGIRGIPAFEASILLLIEPALNPIWAWLVHGEAPGTLPVVGGALILVASLLRAKG